MVDNLNIIEEMIYEITIQTMHQAFNNFFKLPTEDRAQYAKKVISYGEIIEESWPNVNAKLKKNDIDIIKIGKNFLVNSVVLGIQSLGENNV